MIARKSALPRTMSAYLPAFAAVGTLSTIWKTYGLPPILSNSLTLLSSFVSVSWSMGSPREYRRIIAP
jgi:hypothetical protein